MKEKALISIIIPVYNAQSRLEQCVMSIKTQTYTKLEICLINDGSTDESGALCDRLAAEDTRIRVFHKENGGVSTARNRGLDEATGEYVVFVDADDYLASNGIEKMVEAIAERNCDIAIAGKYIDFYGNIFKKLPLKESKILETKQQCAEELLYLNQSSNFDVLWNKIYAKQFIDQNNVRFDPFATTSQDLIFNVDCFLNTPRVALVADAFYYYYKGFQETIVSRYNSKMYAIMQLRKAKLAELFQFYELEDQKEVVQWEGQAYLETVFNATVNIFRKGSPLKYRDRCKFIKSLYDDQYLQEISKRSSEIEGKKVLKLFVFFYKCHMIYLQEGTMHFLYKVNQLIKRIKYRNRG